ncbi:MAG: pyridoxal 5'-phosphate synthase, partial [Ignavibacteriaceae bacterium]
SSAALLFFWAELERQVRIEGKIRKIPKAESQKYFDTRPVESRIAAWASEQSNQISGRGYLEKRFREFEKKFTGKKIPIPPNWGGFRVVPNYFEFWQGRENRLHDRICYKKVNKKWKIFRLAP